MHNLLIFDLDQQTLPLDGLERIFKSIEGFREVRYNTPVGTPIEADYVRDDDFTIVRLNSKQHHFNIRHVRRLVPCRHDFAKAPSDAIANR